MPIWFASSRRLESMKPFPNVTNISFFAKPFSKAQLRVEAKNNNNATDTCYKQRKQINMDFNWWFLTQLFSLCPFCSRIFSISCIYIADMNICVNELAKVHRSRKHAWSDCNSSSSKHNTYKQSITCLVNAIPLPLRLL